MWASRILGWPSHGLGAILHEHFGVELNKKYQRANWGLRPLPPKQLGYARLDSHFLLSLYERQVRELKEQGRWRQAQHRFNKLMQTRWEPKPFDPDGFWRLSGVRQLDDRGRGVLRALYLLRDEQARAEDRPPFKVLGNRALVDLSAQRPTRLEDLHEVKGVSHRIARKYGRKLLSAMRQGASQPLRWEDRPRPTRDGARHKHRRPSPVCQARFEALRAWRNATADKRGVEPDIILANQILRDIAQLNPQSQAEMDKSDVLARWQVEEFGPDLLRILRRHN
jgi:ribonuclease D